MNKRSSEHLFSNAILYSLNCTLTLSWRNSSQKEATLEVAILKLSRQPDRNYVTSVRTTRNWRVGGKTRNWLGISYKVSKIYSSQAIIHLTIFNAIISEFGACLSQSNITQELSEWLLQGLWRTIWTKSLGRNYVTKMKPGRWVLFQTSVTMFEFWASLETYFISKTCTLEAETSVGG